MEGGTVVRLLRLGRLHFVLGGLLLYLLGALLALAAGADLDPWRLGLGYAVLFCAHLSVSYSNDYFDAEGDRTTEPTLFSGGSKVLVEHPELRPLSRALAVGLIAASLSLGATFIWLYAYPAWFMGFIVLGNLMGWYYSAPPLRFASRGLGELSTMVTAGLLLPAMGYLVVAGALDAEFLAVLPATMLYGLVFIINVQVPDIESDLLAGKGTLVARRGRPWAFGVTGVLLLAATAYLVAMAVVGPAVPLATDYRGVALASLLPLAPGLASARGRHADREAATRFVTGNVGSVFAFVAVLCGYLWATHLA